MTQSSEPLVKCIVAPFDSASLPEHVATLLRSTAVRMACLTIDHTKFLHIYIDQNVLGEMQLVIAMGDKRPS